MKAWPASVLLLLLVCASSSVPGAVPEAEASKSVDAIAKRLKGSDPYAAEYLGARRIHWLDVSGDGKDDVVALFTMEGMRGGNNYLFYMAVLLSEKGSLVEQKTLQIGGKSLRMLDFDSVTFQAGRLTLKTREYAPGDSTCCPSLTGNVSFEVSASDVREVPAAP